MTDEYGDAIQGGFEYGRVDDSDAEPADDSPDAAAHPFSRFESMSAEEIERENAERMERLRSKAREAMKLSEEEETALEALAEPDTAETAEVELHDGVVVDVRVKLPAAAEDAIDRISKAESFAGIRGTVAHAMSLVIDGGPYASERVWLKYAEVNGTPALFEMFDKVTEPALSRLKGRQAAKSFRSGR